MTVAVIPEQVIPGYRLGRHLRHDPRSKAYRWKRTAANLVTTEDWPTIPCLNQRNVGACTFFSGTELLASKRFKAVRPATLDNAFALDGYREVTRSDPFPGSWEPDDTGSDGLSVAKVFVTRGYSSGYQHVMDLASLLAAIQVGGLIIGITWKSGCDNPNSDGIIRWTGAIRGGHELYLGAYDNERQLFGLQNHWGSDWGINGRCWIPVADLAAALADDGDATIILPATVPAPVPTPPADADAILWGATRSWAAARHTGSNAKAATSVKAWAVAKGL